MKVRDCLEGFIEPYRSWALKEFKRQGGGNQYVDSESEALELAFVWRRSPQDHDVWQDYREYLDRLNALRIE